MKLSLIYVFILFFVSTIYGQRATFYVSGNGNKSLFSKHPTPSTMAYKHGFELNPLGLLSSLGHKKNGNYISFGYSYFGLSKSSELTFPVVYIGYDNFLLNVDFKYREFLKGERSGIFVSIFGRLTTYREEPSLNSNLSHTQRDYETKFGVGVGIGYRVFYPTRFYWGISFSSGRYFAGGTRDPSFLNFYRNQRFIDAEFLKIGYLF